MKWVNRIFDWSLRVLGGILLVYLIMFSLFGHILVIPSEVLNTKLICIW